jgi:hypothetical protein
MLPSPDVAACAVPAVAAVSAAATATTPVPATPAAAAAVAPAMKERRVTFGISLVCAVFPPAYAEGTEAVFPHEEREMLSRRIRRKQMTYSAARRSVVAVQDDAERYQPV